MACAPPEESIRSEPIRARRSFVCSECAHSPLWHWFVCACVLALLLVLAALSVRFLGYQKLPLQRSVVSAADAVQEWQQLNNGPRSDTRKYAAARLTNGAQVLAIEDPRSLSAAFAVAVMSGSFDEPTEIPGLAHFCEHMLFLGTEKYPDPKGFDKFVNIHGGSQNAYTDKEATVYYVSFSQSVAAEGLDRFADMFRAPLFNASGVHDEVNAVNSEHMKNVQSPAWRTLAVMEKLANPSSPVSRFSTGDLETLEAAPRQRGQDPVGALRQYFQDNYCPARLRVVSFGPTSIASQLKALAVAFGKIEEGSGPCGTEPRRTFQSPDAWPPDRKGQWVDIQGVTSHASLLVHFYLPDYTHHYASKPWQYVEFVLNYEGEKSLVVTLRDDLGLVHTLSASTGGTSAGWQLGITFALTDSGRRKPEAVLDALFAYLASLQSRPVDEDLLDSLSKLCEQDWTWQEPWSSPTDIAAGLAEMLTRVPASDVLWADDLVKKPDLRSVAALMARFLLPSNMNVALVSASTDAVPSLQGKLPGVSPKTLPHYGVKYAARPLRVALPSAVDRWASWLGEGTETGKPLTEPDLHIAFREAVRSQLPVMRSADGSNVTVEKVSLPEPPRRISIGRGTLKPARASRSDEDDRSLDSKLFGPPPRLLSLGPALDHRKLVRGAEVWYRRGWTSNSPLGSPRFSISIALRVMKPLEGPEEDTALDDMRMLMFNNLLGEEIGPQLVDVQIPGATFGITVDGHGLQLEFGGFPHVLAPLVEKSLHQLRAHAPLREAPGRFERVARDVRESLESHSSMPISYARDDLLVLLTRGAHTRLELLQALGEVTAMSAASALQDIVLKWPLQLTALAMGNVDDAVVTSIVASVADDASLSGHALSRREVGDGQVERVTRVVDPTQPIEVRKRNPRGGDPNDVTIVGLIAGVRSIRNRVALGILGNILGNVAFAVLRTELQLGYVASGGVESISNVLLMVCEVQGNVASADAMESAIHRVLAVDMPKRLKSLTSQELEAIKRSFRESLNQEPFHTVQELSHWWGPVLDASHCFRLRQSLLDELDAHMTSKDILIEAWRDLVSPLGHDTIRKRVVVKYFAGQASQDVPACNQVQEDAAWREQGLPRAYVELLQRERQRMRVVHEVDSKQRNALLANGRYFPTELNCGQQYSGASTDSQLAPHASSFLHVSSSVVQVGSRHFLAQGSSNIAKRTLLPGTISAVAPCVEEVAAEIGKPCRQLPSWLGRVPTFAKLMYDDFEQQASIAHGHVGRFAHNPLTERQDSLVPESAF